MQPLTRAINQQDPAPEQCAAAIIDGLPNLLLYFRREMRSRRGASLSVPQFRTLAHLDLFPSAPLSTIADKIGSALPTVSRQVSRLVSKGLVIRRTSEDDRRQLALRLTAKGKAVLEAARGGTRKEMAKLLDRLPASDRAAIHRAFVIVADLFACTQGSECSDSEPADLAPIVIRGKR